MKSLRRYGVAFLALAFGTGILIACGDDDSVLLQVADGGIDGAKPDSANNLDSSSRVDAVAEDSATSDATSDAGADVGPSDASKDVQADVDLPPIDAGGPGDDASALAFEFPQRVAQEICRTTARCCFGDGNTQGDASVDGGTYDATKCYNLYYPNGFNLSNPGTSVDYGKLTYDAAKAAECLGRIQVLACGANAAEYRAVVAACYAALEGNGGAGAACKLNSECQPGFFCNTSVAGGTCEAIRGSGAACGDWTTNASQAQGTCSTRFSGAPPRFCKTLDESGNAADASTWTCNDARSLGSVCWNNSWCDGNGVCSPSGSGLSCQPFITIFNQSGCNLFVKH